MDVGIIELPRVIDGNRKLWLDEDGVVYVGVIPFLLEDIVSGMIR